MSDTVIKLENISKQYRLGTVGSKTLRGDLQRWWYLLNGKEDPILKLGRSNELSKSSMKGISDYVWALKDINLEFKKGDIIGVIGKNGAGKSTLLKLLSRVTSPTTGQIKVKGKIASLLEVGTGFHPELTGRENIFLNGAILGMTKSEIRSKFDEIVDFAGVAKYIDTPVKRYSSGMYVRLAFAVAAHLEPDILVVDEVLAVGDAEFQKKAVGKMKNVSRGEGRTVLFVSHNMASIQHLCSQTLLLTRGKIDKIGNTSEVINYYNRTFFSKDTVLSEVKDRRGNGKVYFVDHEIKGVNTTNNLIESFKDFSISLTLSDHIDFSKGHIHVDMAINNNLGVSVAWLSTNNFSENFTMTDKTLTFLIKNNPLAPGDYSCNLLCMIAGDIADSLANVCSFTVLQKDYYGTGKLIPTNQGNVILNYSLK